MPLPGFQDVMTPILNVLADGEPRRLRDVVAPVAQHFKLTGAELQAKIPSGRKTIIYDRIGWACTYLRKAGLLTSPKRGVVAIADRGREMMAKHPNRVDVRLLRQFPEFRQFHEGEGEEDSPAAGEAKEPLTPHEGLEDAYRHLRRAIEDELLDHLQAATAQFFERTVVELLVRMGYGGSLEDAGRAVGQSHDGGIDGIIKEDRLGLDAIYIQAKKWTNTVGRPEVQKFVGALQGQRARKGVFITTGTFSGEAHEYVRTIDAKVVLMDGAELARLMFDHGVGVSTVGTYEVKRIDNDFFAEE